MLNQAKLCPCIKELRGENEINDGPFWLPKKRILILSLIYFVLLIPWNGLFPLLSSQSSRWPWLNLWFFGGGVQMHFDLVKSNWLKLNHEAIHFWKTKTCVSFVDRWRSGLIFSLICFSCCRCSWYVVIVSCTMIFICTRCVKICFTLDILWCRLFTFST